MWLSCQRPSGQASASAGEVVSGNAGSCSPLGPDVLLLILMVYTLCIYFWFSGHRAKCDIKHPSTSSYEARVRGYGVSSYKGSSPLAPSSCLIFSHRFFHLKFSSNACKSFSQQQHGAEGKNETSWPHSQNSTHTYSRGEPWAPSWATARV